VIFVLDLGNTNIKCGVFKEDKLIHSFKLSTLADKTADEYGIVICASLERYNISPSDINGVIISSVIPSVNYTLDHMCRMYFNIRPMFVSPGIKTGINIKYKDPKELGADRIVNAVASYNLYGGPTIIIDFGTATTFGVISKEGDFLGGAICPGIKIATEALTKNAAKLPHVELTVPESVIGTGTITSMQSGIIFGYVGTVEYLITKMKENVPKAKVVATGGLFNIVAPLTKKIDIINPTLTLTGLNILYKKNFTQN